MRKDLFLPARRGFFHIPTSRVDVVALCLRQQDNPFEMKRRNREAAGEAEILQDRVWMDPFLRRIRSGLATYF